MDNPPKLDADAKLILALVARSEGYFYHMNVQGKQFLLRRLPQVSVLNYNNKDLKLYRYSFDSLTELGNVLKFGDHYTALGSKIESEVWLEGFEHGDELFVYEAQKHQIFERLSSKFKLKQEEKDLILDWRKISKIDDIISRKEGFYLNLMYNQQPLELIGLAKMTLDEIKQIMTDCFDKNDFKLSDTSSLEKIMESATPAFEKTMEKYIATAGKIALQRILDSPDKDKIIEEIAEKYKKLNPVIHYIEQARTDYFDKCAQNLISREKSKDTAKQLYEFREFIYCMSLISSKNIPFSQEETEKFKSLRDCIGGLRKFIRKHPAINIPIKHFFEAVRDVHEKTVYLVSPEEFRQSYNLTNLPEAVREYDLIAKEFGGKLEQMNLIKATVGDLGERCPLDWTNMREEWKQHTRTYTAPVYKFEPKTS
jgi:hypothetical protein